MTTEASRINVGKETVKGTVWTYATNYSGQILVFITTIILARLLSKDDYGLVGYATVTISLLNVLSDLGIGPALIYHRDDPEAADTAFWLSLIFSIGLFIITWLVAPLAAIYFNDPRASAIIRISGLVYPISAFANVHDNLLRKNLDFRKKFIPEFTRATSKGLVSIVMALLGGGAWSLVVGQLGGRFFSVISYWMILPYRPAFKINRKIARSLISYGLYIVTLNTLAVALSNVDYLLVGRYLGAAALGVYTLAFRIPELLINDFCNSLATVLFPLYVKMRDDPESLSKAFITTLRFVAVITVPLGIGLAMTAQPFVLAFLTDKWAEAIPVIQAISIFSMLFSLSYNTGSIYKAKGQVNIMTWLAIVRLVMTIPLVYWAVTGLKDTAAVGWVQTLVAVFSGTLNLVVASRMTGVPFMSVLDAIRPAAVSAAVMAAAIWGMLAVTSSVIPLVQFILAVLAGGTIYLVVLYWQQKDLFIFARQTITAALARRNA